MLVSKWSEYEKHPVGVNSGGGVKKPTPASSSAPFVNGGGGIKKPAPAFPSSNAPFVNGGGIKKPAPTFAPPPTFFGGAGVKKPVVAATTATLASSKFPAFVNDLHKRKRNGEDSELDEVESSAAPLEFDVDSSSRERDERMAQDFGELEGTEAFSVDSM